MVFELPCTENIRITLFYKGSLEQLTTDIIEISMFYNSVAFHVIPHTIHRVQELQKLQQIATFYIGFLLQCTEITDITMFYNVLFELLITDVIETTMRCNGFACNVIPQTSRSVPELQKLQK